MPTVSLNEHYSAIFHIYTSLGGVKANWVGGKLEN